MLEQLKKNSGYTTFPELSLDRSKNEQVENGIPGAATPLSDYIAVYQRYQDYKKAICLARLTALGLPVLEGFVIRTFSDEVIAYLGHWMYQHRMKHLMLCFDSCQETDSAFLSSTAPQILTLEDLPGLRSPLPEHVVAIVLEGDHELKQSYAALTVFLEDYITCEIIGPDFDIEDLADGHIIPHEWFSFRRKERNDDRYKDLGPADLIQHTIISPTSYLQSRETRYNPLYNGTCWQYSAETSFEVEQRLVCEPEPYDFLLLHHSERYTPISYERLSELYSYISELDMFYSDEMRGKVVAASFLQRKGLVFWSISGLSLRYYPVRLE